MDYDYTNFVPCGGVPKTPAGVPSTPSYAVGWDMNAPAFGDLAVGLGLYPPLAALGVCFGVLYGAHELFSRRQRAFDDRRVPAAAALPAPLR